MSDQNFYEPPKYQEPSGGRAPAPDFVRSKVLGPAIGLIVMGVIYILGALWGIASAAMAMAGIGAAARQEQMEMLRRNEQIPEEMREFLMQMNEVMSAGPLGLIMNVVAVGIGGVILFGGIRMKGLRSYPLALTASILSLTPCLNSCCCIGIPIGVWALVVLLNSDVKQSFS